MSLWFDPFDEISLCPDLSPIALPIPCLSISDKPIRISASCALKLRTGAETIVQISSIRVKQGHHRRRIVRERYVVHERHQVVPHR